MSGVLRLFPLYGFMTRTRKILPVPLEILPVPLEILHVQLEILPVPLEILSVQLEKFDMNFIPDTPTAYL